MAIINLTPDSFFSESRHGDLSPSQVLKNCERAVLDGADILDLGAESTRPGAQPISHLTERERLAPVLPDILKMGVPVSLDTYHPETMAWALDLGVDIINDVWALRQTMVDAPSRTALHVLAEHPTAGICIMHMHGEPQTMQVFPMETSDVVTDVSDFLCERLQLLSSHAISANRVMVDPGVGFGKTPDQNLRLLAQQKRMLDLPCAGLLIGWSRKSTLGWVMERAHERVSMGSTHSASSLTSSPEDRLGASLVAAVLAADRGATVLRVHDVKQTLYAMQLWREIVERQER